MKTFLQIAFFLFFINVFAQNGRLNISGLVTSDNQPIANVSVMAKGTSRGVLTNSIGEYIIDVNPKEVLIFSYVGMQTVEIDTDYDTSIIDVQLLPKVELLDEVTVKKKRPFTQKELLAAYSTNKRLIKTAWGIVDKDRASYAMRIIDGKELIPVGTDFLYSLQNLYPQMKVIRNNPNSIDPNIPGVYLQNWSHESSPQAIFDVDGVIYEKPPTFLSVNDIERVAILVRNAAIIRYGPQGAGGVIVINTKSTASMDIMAIKKTYDNSNLRDSLYSLFNEPEAYVPNFSEYLKEFNTNISKQEALKLFEKQKTLFEDSPHYFLDMANYFWNRWDDRKGSEELLEFMGKRFLNDVAAQKALAYRYEEQGRFDKALKTYLTILNLESRAAQSSRNVANAYNELGNYRMALAVYARYEYAINELDSIAFDVSGTDILMGTEVSNIIKLHRKQLSVGKTTISEVIRTPSTRVVFEWNNDHAEFELQFIGSDESIFNWNKTKNETDILLQKQKQKGYATKQFFLEDILDEEWQVNINYFGNRSNTPTYLKVTAFFDYGKSTQSKEFKVYKLVEENTLIALLSLNNKLNSVSW